MANGSLLRRVARGGIRYGLQIVLPFAVLLAVWQAVSPLWSVSLREVMADPWSIFSYIGGHPASALGALQVTVLEALIGYSLGNLAGFVVGVTSHLSRRLGGAIFPVIVVVQAVPVITFSSIVILWFGNDIGSRAVLAGYLSFFPMALNVYRGLGNVDRNMLRVMEAFGAPSLRQLLEVKLPYILPSVFVALRASVVLAMSGAMVGELFGATNGLGALLLSGLYYQASALVWTSIYLAGAVSLIAFFVISVTQRIVLWW